jgi:hypothetical protein
MGFEVARVSRPSAALEIGGRSHKRPPHRAKPTRSQAGILQGRDPQRQVETIADQINPLVAQVKVDLDLGVSAQKFGQDRRQMLDAERHWRGHPHHAAGGARLGRGLGLGRLPLRQDTPGSLKRALAGLRQGQPT